MTNRANGTSSSARLAPRSEELGRRLEEVIDRAVGSVEAELERDDQLDLDNAGALLELALELVTEQLAGLANQPAARRSAELCQRVLELHAAQRELEAFRTDQRTAALSNVQEGLSRLRGITSVTGLLAKATREVCRSCGFDRSIIFRVDGGSLIAESAYVVDDESASTELLERGRDPIGLAPQLIEADVLRRKIPRIATTDGEGSRPGLIAVLAGSPSYVAAPIAPEGRVIGVIAADCPLSGRRPDGLDRDTLWAFAEGLGYAAERAVFLQRLRNHREEMTRLARSSQSALATLCEAQIELTEINLESSPLAAAGLLAAKESRLDSLLSTRELEVVELLAEGATNARIADCLVISENSVKSHVARILRKLHAANRAEAVSRFLRLSQQGR